MRMRQRKGGRFDTLGMTGGPVEMIDTVPAAGQIHIRLPWICI